MIRRLGGFWVLIADAHIPLKDVRDEEFIAGGTSTFKSLIEHFT